MDLALIPPFVNSPPCGAPPVSPSTSFTQEQADAFRSEMNTYAKYYTVILASGSEDGGKRATLALSMGCTALSMDLDTRLFLVGDGSFWAYEGHTHGMQVDGFPPLDELLENVLDFGGNIAVCSTCDHALCFAPGAAGAMLRRRPGVQIQGMATVMEHLLKGRAVTF